MRSCRGSSFSCSSQQCCSRASTVTQEAAARRAEVNQPRFPPAVGSDGLEKNRQWRNHRQKCARESPSTPSDSEQTPEGREARLDETVMVVTRAWLSAMMELLKWFWQSWQLTRRSQRCLKRLCCLLPKQRKVF